MRQFTLKASEFVILRASRHMPPGEDTDKYLEWTAELPFIIDDLDRRFRAARMWSTLMFAVGQHQTVHKHPRASRYSWGYLVSDVFMVGRAVSYGRTTIGIASLYIIGGAMPASLVGGLISTIGIFAGLLSVPGTATVVTISAIAGACIGAAAGGTRAGRQVVRKVRETWRTRDVAKTRQSS